MIESRLPVPREEMLRRIYGEYLEMPGLRLTCEQAQRLWNLDRQTCVDLLGELVASRFLARTPAGQYARSVEDALATSRVRTASATLRSKPFAARRSA